MNFKNQHKITVEALGELEHIAQTDKQFLVALNWDELLDVMRVLSNSEFVLWLYLLKWRGKNTKTGDKKVYYFSPVNIEIETGLSESTCRRAKQGLERLGFLQKVNPSSYNFIPYPPSIEDRAVKLRAETILKHQVNTYDCQNDSDSN